MKYICNLIFILSLFFPSLLYAQADSIKQPVDSLVMQQENAGVNKLKELNAERISDSLKRMDLQRQLDGLKSGDQRQRNSLQSEIEILNKNDSLRLLRQKKQVDSLRKFIKGETVVFYHHNLFNIYARQGSFTAKERAIAIMERLEKIVDEPDFSSDSLQLSNSEQSVDLTYGNLLICSISDLDAIWANTDRTTLSARILKNLKIATIEYRRDNSWQVILKEILLTLLVISVVIFIIYMINKLFHYLLSKIVFEKGKFNEGIRIKNYELMNAERQLDVLKFIASVLRYAIIILVIYLALPVLFGIFPFTRDLSVNLLNYITSPLKKIGLAIWQYVPNLMTILVLAVVFRYVLRFVRYIKTEVERGKLMISGFYKDWANPTYQIIRVLILAFALIVIFPYLPGSDSGVFKGVSVFMGVLFTFGSAGALGNVVAGLVLTYMRAFKIGDRVKIGEVTGDIIEKTLLVTRIRTIKNEVVSIPNSTVMGNHTINFSEEAHTKGLIVNTVITMGYDVPWRQVHEILIKAALNTEYIDQDPEPFVLQTSLDDYYVSYSLNGYTKYPNKQAKIYSDLHANVQDLFNEAGLEIMSPTYNAIRDGNLTTTPREYLPKDYTIPGFRTQTQNTSPSK